MKSKYIILSITLFIIQLILIGCSVKVPLNTKFDALIKIYNNDDYKSANIIAKISCNKLVVYDFNISESIDGLFVYQPVLNNNKQVELDPSDPKYIDIISEIFLARCGDRKTDYKFYIENTSKTKEFVSYTFVLIKNPYPINYDINKVASGTCFMSTENINFCIKIGVFDKQLREITKNSISIVDEKFNIEYWEDIGKGIELVDQKNINVKEYTPRNYLESDTINSVIQFMNHR